MPEKAIVMAGAPGNAVARKVTFAALPEISAATSCSPARVPSVHSAYAFPSSPVSATSGETVPAPSPGVNRTRTPGTGFE